MTMKKLYRSNADRVLAGVCGGVGEYFGIDPALLRLGFAALFVLGGSGLLAYILAAVIIPKEGDAAHESVG